MKTGDILSGWIKPILVVVPQWMHTFNSEGKRKCDDAGLCECKTFWNI